MRKLIVSMGLAAGLFLLSNPNLVLAQGTYQCNLLVAGTGNLGNCIVGATACDADFEPGTECSAFDGLPACSSAGPFTCVPEGSPGLPPGLACSFNGAPVSGVQTAIGCIPFTEPNNFAGVVIGWAISIGGGIALLLIAFSSIQIMTSSGVPEKLKAGREMLTAAISGLLLLIFSVFVLRIIGLDILRIPGI